MSGRFLFTHAAIFNVSIGLSMLLAYQFVFGLLGITPIPENPIYLHLFGLLVVIFGIGYYWAGVDANKNISVIKMGAIGKSLVFVMVLVHFLKGNTTWNFLAIASVDIVYAILFLRELRRLKSIAG